MPRYVLNLSEQEAEALAEALTFGSHAYVQWKATKSIRKSVVKVLRQEPKPECNATISAGGRMYHWEDRGPCPAHPKAILTPVLDPTGTLEVKETRHKADDDA